MSSNQRSRQGYYILEDESKLLDGLDDLSFRIYHCIRRKMDKETKIASFSGGWDDLIAALKVNKRGRIKGVDREKRQVQRATETLLQLNLLLKINENNKCVSFQSLLSQDYNKNDNGKATVSTTVMSEQEKSPISSSNFEFDDADNGRHNGNATVTRICNTNTQNTKPKKNTDNIIINACALIDENVTNSTEIEISESAIATRENVFKFMHSKGFQREHLFRQKAILTMNRWQSLGVSMRSVVEEFEYVSAVKAQKRQACISYYENGVIQRHYAEEEIKKTPPTVTLTSEEKSTTRRGINYVGFNRSGQREKRKKNWMER